MDSISSQQAHNQGALNWRLSSHPVTLVTFLVFRLASVFTYLFGLWFSKNFVLIFIIVVLLLAADFYYCKNIAGRRLVGLRWWNETTEDGAGTWVFESADETRQPNPTDSRFFWLSLYAAPVLWILLAIAAIFKFEFIWLSLVAIAVVLGVTNGMAFSRADKFGNASNFAGRAWGSSAGGLASRMVGNVASRFMFSGR